MAKETKTTRTFSALEFLRAKPTGNFRVAYAFVGKDEFFRWKCIQKIKALVLGDDLPGSTLKEFDELPDVRAIFDELRTTPFLGLDGYRLVVVKPGDKFVSEARDRLESYLGSPNPTSILAVACTSLPSNTRVYKGVAKGGCIVDCPKLRWRDMSNWVNLRAEQLDVKIHPAAIQQLMNVVGSNPGALESELEKLAAYRAEDKFIKPEDIHEIVGFSRSQSIFELIEHVGQRDTRKALGVLQQLLLAGESVQMIVSMLARHYRQLWQAYRMKKAGRDLAAVAADVGVPPFVVEKLFRQVANVRSEIEFARRVQRLAAADVESKTQSISDESERWIETLVVELCTARA